MDSLRQDVRFALRGLRRSPAFTVTAIAILAIGIGMSVAMFTVFRTVLVARLPIADQDRVAVMWTYRVPTTDYACDAKCLDEARRRSTTMQDIAPVVHWGTVSAVLMDGERSVPLGYTGVGANFFEVLGARAFLGRLLVSAQDEAPAIIGGAPPANPAPLNAVLSYRAWTRAFHGDSSIIGRTLVEPLFSQRYTIVGVAPPGLDYPSGIEMWIPMPGGRTSGYSSLAVARLKPGVTLAAARDEYVALSNRIEPLLKATGAHAETFGDTVIGNVRPVIAVLTSAVALLLLITCLNVGNLLLLRASSRARELGLRRILGATYADIIRQLLVESSALAVGGGVLGFGLATVLLRATRLLTSRTLPRVDELAVANAPFALAASITLVAMILFGVVPSLAVARASQGGALRIDFHTGNETRRRRMLRDALVASQVALAMITLGGAGLLARSLERLERQDAGYNSDHLAILDLSWDIAHVYKASNLSELAQRIEQRFANVPGVAAVTPTVIPPLVGTGVWQIRMEKEGQTGNESQNNPTLNADIVGPGFFKTFGTRILRGRGFTAEDRATSPLVIVVSEQFARRYWPGEDPIGKRLRASTSAEDGLVGGNGFRTVVGVVQDTHLRTIREATPLMYFPVTQGYWQGNFAVRTAVPLATLEPALKAAAREVGSGVALQSVEAMDDLLAVPLAEPRLSALLMSAFGLVALLLSAIGLYGVMASLVRDQTRDIGIRMALGATPSRVRDDVLGRAALTVGIGAIVGVAGAIAGSRLISGLLFHVTPTDPAALASAVVVLLAAGVVAAYIPARRATKIDPAQALRA
jgi:putative ABC transport system permease protein